MLTSNQVATMISLQCAMNTKVDKDWLTARHPYLLAVVIEGAEAIEHHGWKWWKHQDQDLSQLQMELIDIWHFMLSELILVNNGDIDKSCNELLKRIQFPEFSQTLEFDRTHYHLNKMDLISKLELLIGTSVAKRIEFKLFEEILKECKMDWDELYRQYVGKNVLNFFRQDHGYKQGSYEKIWGGKEDNEHLVEILAQMDIKHADIQQNLYLSLSQRYQSRLDPQRDSE